MLNRKINFKGAYILASVFVTSLTSGPAIAQVDIFQNSKNNQIIGITSLMSAVIEKDIEGVKFFIRSQPDNINSKNIGGATALHIASRNNDTEIVRILIKNGADINAKDGEGWTPLMRAALSNNPEIVDILLSNGAKILDKNTFKESAFIHASVADCDLCLGLMIEKIDLTNLDQKKEASKEINDAFIVARNRNNLQSQNVLKSGIDDIYESNKVAQEEAKRIEQEALAQREVEIKTQEEEKRRQEELGKAQEEAKKLALEEQQRQALEKEKIKMLEAQKMEKEGLAAQLKEDEKPVETVNLSLGDEKEESVEGVSAFTKETGNAAENATNEIAQIAPTPASKKSGWFNLFGLFGSSQEDKVGNDNIVTTANGGNDLGLSNQDLPLVVKEFDLPEPTKIIDRDNELKIVAPKKDKQASSDINAVKFLEPVIEPEQIITTSKSVNKPKELENKTVALTQKEVKEEQSDNHDNHQKEVEGVTKKAESQSFFGRLFGFGKKEQTVQTPLLEPEIVEPKTPKPEILEPKTLEPKTLEPKTLEPKKAGQAKSVEKAKTSSVSAKNADVKKSNEAKVEKSNKVKKFKFKSGPSIMKPDLKVSEPPVSKEALEEEVKKQEKLAVKKSFFARLFGWGNDDKEKKQLEEKQKQPEKVVEESNLNAIDQDLVEEKKESSIKKPSEILKEVTTNKVDNFKIIDSQAMVEPAQKVQEALVVTEQPQQKSGFSFFGLFSNKKDSFVEQDLDDIVQQEEIIAAKDIDISSNNQVKKAVSQEQEEIEVKKLEEKKVDKVKKESGFSFFGLFSSSKKQKDNVDEQPKVQVKQENIVPTVKEKTKKFYLKQGPSINQSSNLEEQVKKDVVDDVVQITEKKKSGFFSFFFGE